MAMQIHQLIWRGGEIEAIYTPCSWGILAHLEIRSLAPERAPRPINETGYLSRFLALGAHSGDVAAQVIAWLDESAVAPA